MAPTIVLITGANRGIGRGILELYLKKPDHTVIAANRDPSHASSLALADLPKAEGTTLQVIKIDALSPTDPAAGVETLAAKGITHIDILIANAGIALSWPKVTEVQIADIQKHVDVNIYGFVRLYQAFRPLLKDAQAPKNFIPMQNAAYAPTKAVQHWYTKAISVEDSWLNAFPIDPGWVQTDIGNRGAEAFSFEKAAVTIEDSTTGLVKIIDESTLETHSGKLFKFDGSEEPW
ncbi:uncharacterized protein N7479_010950 [Penicillium vulpinum]|uniref:NAD(P)-binding domain-containing protein n=1 Tax=Penicillium vulpinum TaxID=29845 RepID=A0A1V6S0S3_9EURO|nr:uncharacterized protein N7479_010950 [Penicillium vulpinum]KAJ5952537.1 hypothetical protein N7479_010950 [Penicillium vulpinum]OQE07344.1 hypothetical protein PENVUL_c014G07727 [Penicillium vulpinum]